MKTKNNFKRVSVLLVGPYDKTFDYHIDEKLCEIGKFVLVPFRSKKMIGIIISNETDNLNLSNIKSILSIIDIPPLTKVQIEFVEFFSRWNCIKKGYVLKLLLNPFDKISLLSLSKTFIEQNNKFLDVKEKSLIDLNIDQIKASKLIIESLKNKISNIFLLEGVPGSGKTETYFEAIKYCIKSNKQVLILLPEIGLTSDFDRRFRNRFGIIPDKWHSEIKKSVKKKIWIKAISKKTMIVVGARSALFLPLNNLGLIIIDEEHDLSYKQEENLRYHARDMAIYLGTRINIPIILSSATPSFETLYNVSINKYKSLNLPSRATGAQMPRIEIIDLKENPPANGYWISEPMIRELKTRYKNNEQSMLFLNRRGYSNLTICRSCGYTIVCKNCSSWLVEHKSANKYLCHHCGYTKDILKKCSECDQNTLIPCGPGIEKINEEIKNLFPKAFILNVSSDTIKNVKGFNKLLRQISDGEADFIIGTQILAKGYDFSLLNYVGIIDGDVGLNGGDFRASEKYFQLLTQVSGRAGRHLKNKKGLVQVQTYNPKNPILKTIKEMNKKSFFNEEIQHREHALVPPFSRLISIIISSKFEHKLNDYCFFMLQNFPKYNKIEILGPAPAPLNFLRGRHRNRFLIKAPKNMYVQDIVMSWINNIKIPSHIRLSIDVDPYNFL